MFSDLGGVVDVAGGLVVVCVARRLGIGLEGV